jgi:hypothetical protein
MFDGTQYVPTNAYYQNRFAGRGEVPMDQPAPRYQGTFANPKNPALARSYSQQQVQQYQAMGGGMPQGARDPRGLVNAQPFRPQNEMSEQYMPEWDHSALEAELRLAEPVLKSSGDRSSTHSAANSPGKTSPASLISPSLTSLTDQAFLSFPSAFTPAVSQNGFSLSSAGSVYPKQSGRYSSSEHVATDESDEQQEEMEIAANLNALSFLDTA